MIHLMQMNPKRNKTMFGFIVKWIGVIVVTLIAMHLTTRVAPGFFTLGTHTINYSFVVGVIVFFFGFRLTVK